MRILDRIPAVLAFRTVPTAVALVVVYAAIFISVLLTDQIPSIPKHTRGLDLDQAYLDLHQVFPCTLLILARLTVRRQLPR